MELYILDDSFRRIEVVDSFISLIWNDRYTSAGEFELELPSTSVNRSRFYTGIRLAQNESYSVMEVETVEDESDDEGARFLKVTGRSIEKLLDDRAARVSLVPEFIEIPSETPGDPPTVERKWSWTLEGSPVEIVNEIVDRVCVNSEIDIGDKIPYLTMTPLLPPGTIDPPTSDITVDIEPMSVYDVVSDICESYDLGFRILRGLDTSTLHFDVYTGVDRSGLQSDVPPIVFSPNHENLKNVSEIKTTLDFKNVAYVMSPQGAQVVYAHGANEDTTGFDRRVLTVKIDSIPEEVSNVPAYLIQRGTEELMKHRQLSAFDGEINQYNISEFGLGDLVDMRDFDKSTNQMRVTEKIYVSDAEGDRVYPTLSLDTTIVPGVWLSWEFQNFWDTYSDTWEDLGAYEEYSPGTPWPPLPPEEVLGHKGPVGAKLTIPTHVTPAGGQTTSPAVVDIGVEWNGYRYWMAHTPYPAGNDAHSDPNVVASNNKTTWVKPSGLTNPIDDQPGSPKAYNSGVYLHFDNNKLVLFWRTYIPGAETAEKIHMTTSSDGRTWSKKELIWESDAETRLFSPCIFLDGNVWTMYAVDVSKAHTPIVRLQSKTSIPHKTSWSAGQLVTITPALPSGRKAWQLRVQNNIGSNYIGMINDCKSDTTGGLGDLYMIQSDDGLNFQRSATVAIPRTKTGEHTALYTPSLVYQDDGSYDCYYAGWVTSPNVVWNVFRTNIRTE